MFILIEGEPPWAAAISADARADCRLSVSSSFIPLGQPFSFTIELWDFSPLPPDPQYRVVFFGAKDGVPDIQSPGEAYPGTFNTGTYVLGGFGNPSSGGFSGSYIRWAVIYDKNNTLFCVSNTVDVTLQ